MPWLWNLRLERCGHSRSPSNLLVGPAVAMARATLNGLGATACVPAPRPTTLAEGRSCFGVGPTRKPVFKEPGVPSIPSLLKTERRGRGLDSVAGDNPADSLMAQGQRCLPYPNSTRPSQSIMGGRPPHGAGRQPVIAESPPSPGGMLNHPRDTALELLSVWIRNTGGSPECRGPRQPLSEYFEPGGRRLGWEPLGRGTSWHGHFRGLQAVPVDLPVGQPPATPGTAGPPRVRDVRPSRGTPASHMRALGVASSSSLPTGNYPRN